MTYVLRKLNYLLFSNELINILNENVWDICFSLKMEVYVYKNMNKEQKNELYYFKTNYFFIINH